MELDQSSFNMRVCAAPNRDYNKHFLKNATPNPGQRCARSHSRSPSPSPRAGGRQKEEEEEEEEVVEPLIDVVGNTRCDRDGLYTFTWRTRN